MNEPNRRVKIPRVFTVDNICLTSEHIPCRSKEESFFEQQFFCAGEDPKGTYCRAAASAKTKYPRDNGNGTCSVVRGNFYLAEGAAHIEKCRYDIMTQLHELHTTYRDTLQKTDKYYLLTIPSVMNSETSARIGQDKETTADMQTLHTTRTTGNRAPSFRRVMQTAAAVLELFERFESDNEARKLFRIKYAGKTYRWGDFFYDAATDAAELYKAAIKTPGRPMVLYGKIGDSPRENRAGKISIWIPNGTRAKVPREKEIISLYIHTSDVAALGLAKGEKVLAIGCWSASGRYLSVSVTAESYTTY